MFELFLEFMLPNMWEASVDHTKQLQKVADMQFQ